MCDCCRSPSAKSSKKGGGLFAGLADDDIDDMFADFSEEAEFGGKEKNEGEEAHEATILQ